MGTPGTPDPFAKPSEFDDTPPDLAALQDAWAPKAACCWCASPLHNAEILGTACYVCPSEPCLQRQLAHAIILNIKGTDGKPSQRLLYLPLPRQAEAHEYVMANQIRRILYGGAAGGGKSKFLRWLAYSLCLSRPGFKVLLLRRTWPELEETHIQESILEEQQFGENGGGIMHVTPSNRRVDFYNHSYIKFGHCQDPKDMAKYLSTEYDLILFDELVTFTEKQYFLISSRARTPRSDGWKPMVVAGTNPGGPGAAWVTETFIHKFRDPKKYPLYNPAQHLYIRALLDDNPHVNASYVEFLMDLDPDLREAYRWGNWDLFPGQYFKEFRSTLKGQPYHVRRIDVPVSLPRRGGMDWGYLRPGVVLWGVVLPDSGRLYIEHEWVFDTLPPSKVAAAVKILNAIWGITLIRCVGDPAMAIRNHETGEDIFETLGNNGFPVEPAHNERVNGWIRCREWLKPWPDGAPGLVISPDCPYLIRTLPQLMQDETKLEDVDTTGEDHAADALRYMVMDYPGPVGALTGTKVFQPGTLGAMFQEAQAAALSGGYLGQYNVGG